MARLGVIVGLAGLLAGVGPADPPLLFQAEGQVLTGACTGGDLRIEGNRNTITVAGACRSLLLKGVGNTVRLGVTARATIRVEGSANRVRYTASGAAPAVSASGPDNEITAATQFVASAAKPVQTAGLRDAGPLSLAGDDQQRIADCAGRDVSVTGARSAYELRGGCRTLLVRGDLLTVRAEMQPGARISVNGLGNVVTWRLRGRGPDPLAIAQGAGSRVQRALPGE